VRLIANLDQRRHANIIGHILFSQFSEPKPLCLLVDTGCSITTLLSDDVTRLSINCTNLQLSSVPSATANGLVFPYLLPNITLFLEIENGWLRRKRTVWSFTFNSINCMKPTNPNLMTPIRVQRAYSLIGMDFLQHFRKWRFNNNELILAGYVKP